MGTPNFELFLDPALARAAIALSVFSLITYFWLGFTVLLIGNRRSPVTWIGGIGLLSAGLFFLCHGALVGAGVPDGPSPSDFWWHLSWVPAFASPLFWAAIGLHYAGLAGVWRRLRLPALCAVGALGLLAALLALVNWNAIASYGDFIRLLDTSVYSRGIAPQTAALPWLPALGLAFVIYISACACLPWASLVARRLLPSGGATGGSGAGEASDAVLLWDAGDAWSRARPALLSASLCMMVAGAVVALVGALVLLAAHRATLGIATQAVLPFGIPATPRGHVPVILVGADLVVQVALTGLGLLVGWAVVRQGVLVERRLPQRGFLSHWRGMACVAGVLACVVAAMASVEPEALPDLLLLVTLVSAAYALFTWQSYVMHDRLLTQLRPFMASMSVGHSGWLATEPLAVEQSVEALFTSLCRDVLGAARGRLALSAGRLHRVFVYDAPAAVTDARDMREWALPVSDDRGVVARLVLGPRVDGAGYTSADLEVARACGQRILDAVGEFAAAQAIASLARRRGLESELSAALPRRVLHDEVLPRLHLAMLRLEHLRALVPVSAPAPVAARVADTVVALPGSASLVGRGADADDANAVDLRAGIEGVVRELGQAHHDLAALMRAAPIATTRHLERGLVSALRAALDGEFRGTFDHLEWQADGDGTRAADALPTILADLLLGATLEAVRNAGRHARGDDLHRRLTLTVRLAADAEYVTAVVADDGVGIQLEHGRDDAETSAATAADVAQTYSGPGARTGLLTHGALIALVNGSLTVHSQPRAGTTVTIRVPGVHRGPDAPPMRPM